MLKILCKRGSASSKLVSDGAKVPRTFRQTMANGPARATRLINWGLFGTALDKYYDKYPNANNLPTLNKNWPGNKFAVLNKVQVVGVPIPETRDSVLEFDGWIYKPNRSAGGNGIYRLSNADGNPDWNRGYAQKEIPNRKYEVRVTAFNWMAPSDWGYWKKFARERENLTWNHQQGGYFEKVGRPMDFPLFERCAKHAARVLDTLGLQFGAVDFIVDSEWHELFLEINTQPGFTADYGAEVYVTALSRLNEMPMEMFVSLLKGERHNDIEQLFGNEEAPAAPEVAANNPVELAITQEIMTMLRTCLQYRRKADLIKILKAL